jgi:transposase
MLRLAERGGSAREQHGRSARMGAVNIVIPAEQRAEVEWHLRRRELTRRVRERLEMVKAAALGDEVERIARWSGRAVATVEHWLARYAEGGVEALADAKRSGRPVQADAAYLAALEAALETHPNALGLAFDVWTSERLAVYLEQETGVHISPGWLRALLAQQGWVCGRPKHTLKHLQDPAAVAASRHELAAVGEKGARRAGALRAPFPGRDASGNQSLSVPSLAPTGPTSQSASRGNQSTRHGVWQRRGPRARADRTGAGSTGYRRVPAVSGPAGHPSPGPAAGDLLGAR